MSNKKAYSILSLILTLIFLVTPLSTISAHGKLISELPSYKVTTLDDIIKIETKDFTIRLKNNEDTSTINFDDLVNEAYLLLNNQNDKFTTYSSRSWYSSIGGTWERNSSSDPYNKVDKLTFFPPSVVKVIADYGLYFTYSELIDIFSPNPTDESINKVIEKYVSSFANELLNCLNKYNNVNNVFNIAYAYSKDIAFENSANSSYGVEVINSNFKNDFGNWIPFEVCANWTSFWIYEPTNHVGIFISDIVY